MASLWLYQQDREAEDLKPVPTKWEVCPSCKGKGSSSAHLGAFTTEEMEELGDDFKEDYLQGMYDRTCETCNGRTTVQTPDLNQMSQEDIDHYYTWLDREHQIRAIEAAERRMGC